MYVDGDVEPTKRHYDQPTTSNASTTTKAKGIKEQFLGNVEEDIT